MKLNNYNFDLKPEKLSSERIKSHQDFDALMGQFQEASKPAPRPRRWLYYISGAAAAALVGFVLYSNIGDNTQYQSEAQAYFAAQKYVSPPQLNIAPDYAAKQLDGAKGGTYTFDNGSTISVPEEAFLDAQGNIVRGQVNVKYREFHDYVDFFLSGIPMEYDSAGVQYQLESAGMVEIFAEQNGQRLEIAPGKELNVELVSEIMLPADRADQVPDFNIYKLDQAARNWVYKGKDNIELLKDGEKPTNLGPEDVMNQNLQKELARIDSKATNELKAIEATIAKPAKPIKPVRANEDLPAFNFDFQGDSQIGSGVPTYTEQEIDNTQSEINQLRLQYANTTWQLDPAKNPDFNEAAASGINWDDMQLNALNVRDYELTLIKGAQRMKLVVNPVLAGNDYDQALSQFNKELKSYNQQLSERQAKLQAQTDKLKEEIAQERALAQQSYDEQIAAYRAQGNNSVANDIMVRRKIVNRFQATSFGIWNCDRPLPPYMVKVKGEFIDKNKKSTYNQNTAYLVDKNRNTVCRFYTGDGVEVAYNKNSDNLLWLMTADNKIAVMKPEEFKRISKDKERYTTFVMNLVDQQIDSEEDVRKILEF